MISFISHWGFIIGSNSRDPLSINQDELKLKISPIRNRLKFYDEEAHYHMFHIPRYISTAVDEVKDVYTDENPVYT
jgi:spermidine synthase